MNQHGSNYFTHRPLPGPWGWGQNSTFSEHGHVAYQIKGNGKCSNMQAHILSFHTPSTPGVGSKVKTIFFLKVVMLYFKQVFSSRGLYNFHMGYSIFRLLCYVGMVCPRVRPLHTLEFTDHLSAIPEFLSVSCATRCLCCTVLVSQ